MPLNKDSIVRKFLSIPVPLEQYSSCFYGGYEAMSIKLNKAADPDFLQSVQLSFPPFDEEHASRYALLMSVFWVCVLPPATPMGDYAARSRATLDERGFYEEQFGDITVTLHRRGDTFFLEAHTPA